MLQIVNGGNIASGRSYRFSIDSFNYNTVPASATALNTPFINSKSASIYWVKDSLYVDPRIVMKPFRSLSFFARLARFTENDTPGSGIVQYKETGCFVLMNNKTLQTVKIDAGQLSIINQMNGTGSPQSLIGQWIVSQGNVPLIADPGDTIDVYFMNNGTADANGYLTGVFFDLDIPPWKSTDVGPGLVAIA